MPDIQWIKNELIELKDLRSHYHQLPEKEALYVFVSDQDIYRLVGSSPILKIGETKNLRNRMKRYFNCENIDLLKDKPKRQTAYRLRSFIDLEENGKFQFYYKIMDSASKKDLKLLEKKLILEYLDKHMEVPPLNMGIS